MNKSIAFNAEWQFAVGSIQILKITFSENACELLKIFSMYLICRMKGDSIFILFLLQPS
jgi:hypothetical protein